MKFHGDRPMYGKFYNPDAKYFKKPLGGYKVRGRQAISNKMRWAEYDAMRGRNKELNRLRKVGKAAGRVGKTMNVAGIGLLAAEGIYKGVKRATGPSGKAFHGQFVDYTSKPTNRGKRGVNY